MNRVAQTSWVLAAGHHIGGDVGEFGTKTFRRSITGQLTAQVISTLHPKDTIAVVVPTRFGARCSRMVQRMLHTHVAAQLPASASNVPGVSTSQLPEVRVIPLAERVSSLEPPTAAASYLVEIEAKCLTITALDFQSGAHMSRLIFDLPRSLLTTPEGIGQLLERIELLAEDLGAPGPAEAEIIFYGELSPCTALATSVHRRKILAFVLEDRTLTDRKFPLCDDNADDDHYDEDFDGTDASSPEAADSYGLPRARAVNVEPTVLRPRPEDMKRSVDVGGLVEAWWPVALIGVIVLIIGGGLLTLLRPGPTTSGTEVISAAATETSDPATPADSSDSSGADSAGSTFEVPSSTVEPTTPKRSASSRISGAGMTMSFPPGWRKDERSSDKLVVVSEHDLPMRVVGVLQPVQPGIGHEELVTELERLVSGQVTLSQLRPEVTIESLMVATYREQPDDRSEVLWHVRLVGDQQISVGCQYRGRLTTELRTVCEQAVASATLG